MDKIEVKYNRDDSMRVEVNGNTVLRIDQNAYGWDNFELVEELTKRISSQLHSAEISISDE